MDQEVGARIRLIREAVGLQAQDLGARVGLDPTVISKIENGKRAIKAVELTRIAEALKVSPLALLEDDPVLSNLPLAARRAGPSITRGGAYQRLLSLSELHVVLAGAGIPTSPNLAGVPDVSALSWLDGATRLADWACGQLLVGPGGQLLVGPGDQRLSALATAIEGKLKVDVLIEPYPDDALSGAAITHRTFPLIFVNSEFAQPRSLFTLAHELGHILAGHADDSITLDRELSGSTDAERMANAFAAIFLMPEDYIRKEITDRGRKVSSLIYLTYMLGVSYESLIYRLHNLRLINAEGRDKLKAINWHQLSSYLNNPEFSHGLSRDQIGRLQYRSTVKPAGRPPALLLQRAWDGYRKGIISIRPLAGLIGLEPEDLIDQIEVDGDIQSSIREVNSSSYGGNDSTESAEELFGGNPF
jgi:Zn-dependent peptidase ImmA (M78 family)/transcriptional regulator with XRE-family HTH domain